MLHFLGRGRRRQSAGPDGMADNSKTGLDSPRAWVVVAGAFLAAFVGFGVTYCFGVFLKPMALEFHVSHAAMSVLFSVIAGLSFFLAPFTGDLADHYGPRPVVAAGALLIGAGLILTAHVHSYPLVMVTYGGGLGAAVACTYIPSVAAVGEWFKVRRDIALGIAISGIGCGTLVAAPVSAMLIERYGWRTSFEIFGWISAGLLALCAVLLARPPVVGGRKKSASSAKCARRPSHCYTSAFCSQGQQSTSRLSFCRRMPPTSEPVAWRVRPSLDTSALPAW